MGQLQAARPDIRRIVALSEESRADEATFRDLESNIRRALQRAGEVPTTEKPVKLGGILPHITDEPMIAGLKKIGSEPGTRRPIP